ncbi:hypothetical protein CP556_24730 [Natrinema sp. CBA1119]|uniref:AN1-type zinc finger domain-containing protein n=1 Tax=Natrinema sp. CBA1119 TaxID=1608465 RepID=UPI000BF77466|nr:hypothetical protein CP556_24730 [Natrinema sp. CBA1119]
MADCDFPNCPGDNSIENSCSYRGYSYCSEHRLPENHDCLSLSKSNTLGPDFSGDIDSSETIPDKVPVSEPAEKSECDRCSNYTTPDHGLCLDCRRKEQTISSRSPGVSGDGSLESNGRQVRQEEEQDDSGGLFSRIKALLHR